MPYLENPAELIAGRYEIEQTIIGFYHVNSVYHLQNENKAVMLPVPETGTVYINPGLSKTYGVNIGDTLTAYINGERHTFTVSYIAANAKSASIYVNANELAEILGVPAGAYNGVLSMEQMPSGAVATKAGRMEELDRNAVSNNISGVINQVIGVIVGAVLIFLALYVNFQDNTRDMLILYMMGYRIKNIRKLLIDVYLPIVWAAFLFTIVPGILLARHIQKSLSISINEYMPFEVTAITILFAFVLLNIIYCLLQSLFGLGIRRTIQKEEISEFVYAE